MKILFLTIILALTTLNIYPYYNESYLDSLQISLEKAALADKPEILAKIALHYLDTNPQKSIDFGQKALSMIKKSNDHLRSVQLLSLIGVAYEYLGSYTKAMEIHQEALVFALKADDQKELANCYLNLANSNHNIGKHDVSLSYNLQALDIYREIDFLPGISKALNNIGNVHLYMGDYHKALGYYMQSMDYKELDSDELSLANTLHNLALTYQALDDYDNAMLYYERALELLHKIGDIYSIAVCYSNLVELHFQKHHYEKSKDYCHQALEIYEQLKNENGIAAILSKLAEIQIAQNDLDNVVDLILKSQDTATKLLNKDLIATNYQLLSEYYEKKGKAEDALLYFKKYKTVNDSISSEETNRKIAELHIQYETGQRLNEIEMLKKNSEHQIRIKNFLIFTVILGIMFFLFLLNLYFEKIKDGRIRQEISEKYQEREILFRTLTENLTAAVFTYDVSGRFKYVNPATSEISGYSETELLEMKFYDFIHPLHKEMVSRRGLSRIQGEDVESSYEFMIITKSGSIRWIRSSSNRVIIQNQMLVMVTAMDITETKNTEKNLKDSDAKMRALFAAMDDVILVLDRTGKYLDIAPTNDALLYKPADELLGNYVSDIFEQFLADYFLRKINQCLQEKTTIAVEYTLNIKGRDYWFDGRLSPLTEDSIILVVRDITKSIKAKEKLVESEKKYRNLVEKIEEGMIITDKNLNFTFVNQAAADIYGYTREEFLTLNVKDLVPPDQFSKIEEQNKLRSELKSSSYVNWNVCKDGSLKLIKVSASPLLKDDKFDGTIALFTDISKNNAVEEKVEATLKLQQSRLEAINDRLQNNLKIISGMLNLQAAPIDQENAPDRFQQIRNRAESMALVQSKLFQSDAFSQADFRDYLKDLLLQLSRYYSLPEDFINLNLDCLNYKLDLDTAVSCGMIVNEVIADCLENGLSRERGGWITLGLEQTGDKKFRLTLTLNEAYPAMKADFLQPASFGRQMIELLSRQLQAELIIDNQNGVKLTFIFSQR